MIEIETLGDPYGATGLDMNWMLSIGAGSVVGLLGEHGAGKTTVLKMMAGLMPAEAPVHVRLNGLDLARERERALCQVTAMVQEDTDPRGDERAGEPFPFPAAAAPILSELDLHKHCDRPRGTLSDGQRRQMVLVQALAADRPIVLLDEPTLGLGDRAAHVIENWIARRVRRPEMTAVIASCRPDLLQRLCDRLIVMRGGRLVADLPARETPILSRAGGYRIRVWGNLDASWKAWFGDTSVAQIHDETIISGMHLDQCALHGLLTKIRDLGLPLISLQRFEPQWEETIDTLF